MNQLAQNPAVDAQPVEHVPVAADGRVIGPRHRAYILLLLSLAYTLNTADRGVLSILIPPIKAEFNLRDWQIGVLSGPMFALVYALCSLPFATLSDRVSRRNLIAATMLVFSGATAFCGIAGSYLQLAAGRFLTGTGESATVPAASAMIADLYPPKKRVSAIALFTAGGSVGGTIAGLVGGIVAHHHGWRQAFFVAGIPGVTLSLLMFFTVREPKRLVSAALHAQRNAVSLVAVLRYIGKQPAFLWLCAGNTLLFFRGGGFGTFENLFLVQQHHLNLEQIGSVHSALGLAGLAVTLVVGKVTDRLAEKNIRWFMYVPVIVSLLGVPFALALLLLPNAWGALVMGGSGALFALCYAAPLYAGAQALVPHHMRARAIAILLLLTMLLGTALGAPAAGLLSDTLAPILGKSDGLRWSMMVMIAPNFLAAYAFWRAAVGLPAGAAKVVREEHGAAA